MRKDWCRDQASRRAKAFYLPSLPEYLGKKFRRKGYLGSEAVKGRDNKRDYKDNGLRCKWTTLASSNDKDTDGKRSTV